ncbi:hypothetical protein QCA50_012579 [Cerrena zonata]|uniref:ribonuclease H n=1 Tax=Cerrena zonata TaxID=2478898 RepID=A0AAW0FSF2_9APHY
MEKIKSPQELTNTFYDPVFIQSDSLTVYVDDSCINQGKPDARAGAGVYWGEGSPLNKSVRVYGPQTNNRGELLAVLTVVKDAPPARMLRIWHEAQGWEGVNGDLLHDIFTLLNARPTAVSLYWLKGHIDHIHIQHDKADERARLGANLPDVTPPAEPLPRPIGWDARDGQTPISGQVKAHTTMNRPATMKDNNTDHSDDPPIQGESLLDAREKNLQRLLECSSDAEFRKVCNTLEKLRPQTSRVTVGQLKKVFEKRMNPPTTLPDSFDNATHALNHGDYQHRPQRSEDTTAERYFSRPVTSSEITVAKEHRRKHSSKSAVGLDKIGYRQILLMLNDDLRDLFNTCVSELDASDTWLTTILTAMLKRKVKGPALNDPNNYRTIGLESCLVKTLTLLIDRRLRKWSDELDAVPSSQNGFLGYDVPFVHLVFHIYFGCLRIYF